MHFLGGTEVYFSLLGHLGNRYESILLSIRFLEFLACHKIDECFGGVLRLALGIHAAERQDLVFAAGDIRSGSKRQIVMAAADGATAVLSAYEYLTGNYCL